MTNEVLLREVLEADLPTFFEQQLDPAANRMAAFPAPGREAFTAHWTRILADETITKKTILFDGHVAGNVVSFERFGEREVGYWIGKKYWGKGVATRALSEFLGHVTTRPLYARVAKHNVASLRVLEKCGFTISGHDTAPADTGGEEVEEFILKLEASATEQAPSREGGSPSHERR